MFKIGEKVKLKNNPNIYTIPLVQQARLYPNVDYKITGIDLFSNSYYGGTNQFLKFRHTNIGVPAEYFDLVTVSVGFVIW